MESVICYINQSSAGIGGEDKADYGPEIRDGVMGPTAAINQMLVETGVQVITAIIYGDNFTSTHRDEAIERTLTTSEDREFDLFLAGPTFQAGRYGVACDEIGKAVSARSGIPTIASTYAENLGTEMFKKDMHVMTGSHSAVSMKRDTDAMVRLADKLLKGQTPEGPDAEDYYAEEVRHQVWREDGVAAANHAVDMLAAKATGQPYQSELIIFKRGLVPIVPTLKDLKHARIALINIGGIIPADNPDRIQSASATHWDRYDISKIDRLAGSEFKITHADFDPTAANADPNVTMPADIMREFLSEGEYDSLRDYLYSIVGTGAIQGEARRMTKEIIPLLKEGHANTIIVVST